MVKACVIKEMLQQIRSQNDLLTALVETLEREDSPAPEVQAVAAAGVLPEKAFLSVNEAAAESGYTRNYMYQLIHQGRLAHSKPTGGKVIIRRDDLQAFLSGNRRSSPEELSERAEGLLNARGRRVWRRQYSE